MNACPAHYFDGDTAKSHAVTLALSDGQWLIEGEGIHLTLPSNAIEIPPPVGSATRFLRLASGARCEIDDTSLEKLFASQDLVTAPSPPKLITRLEQHTRILAVATVLIVAAATGAFFWSMPRLTARLARSLPTELEKKISQSTLSTLDANYFEYSQTSRKRQNEIRHAYDEFLVAMAYKGRPTHLVFRRMARNSANAFALPDGAIIVTDGLIELAKDDDEIMAVLAHEIGHVEHRHSIRMLLQDSATLVLVTALTGDTSVVGNIAGTLPFILTSREFSREFEAEADHYAFNALQVAEVPLHRFIDIMERLENDRKLHEGERVPRYLSTHPPTEERLKRFRAPPASESRAP